MTTPCSEQPRVDRHFGRGLDPADEHGLRDHLKDCSTCRDHYERLLLFTRLDPLAESAEDRLARNLGLPPKVKARTITWAWVAPVALAATAVMVAGGTFRPKPADDGFNARGGATGPDLISLRVVQVQGGRKPEDVGTAIPRDAELAFAYSNRTAHRYFLIYGIDEHRHVYWYYPAWADPAQDPAALPTDPSPGWKELPEAIAQHLDGTTLRIHGWFIDAPLHVKQIESAIAASTDGNPHLEGGDEWQSTLQVRSP